MQCGRWYRVLLGFVVAIALLFSRNDLIRHVAAQQAPAHTHGGPKAPLANPIVNAPDTNEHDTQSTTAVLKIPGGNIVVAAYTNSAVHTVSNNHMTGWARSTDDGVSWSDLGALPDSAAGDGGSPVLARNNTSGRLYMSTLAYTGSSAVQVFKSDSNAASWVVPVNAMPGFGGGDMLDTPRLAVDNFVGTGQGNVYVVARNVAGGGGGSQPTGVYFSRSTDNGDTWGAGPGLLLSPSGTGPNVVVSSDHSIYVFWWINLGGVRQIRHVKSIDKGVSFGPIITVAVLNGTGGDGDLGLGGGFRTNSFPQAFGLNDASVLVIYNDKTGTDKGDIYATSSDTGGASWQTPDRINNDATTNDQFSPSLIFTPDNLHAMVTWYDRRGDPGNSLVERWGLIATGNGSGGASLGPNFRISTSSWPVVIGQDSYVAADYMGNYDLLSASNTAFYVTWGDNRAPNAGNSPLPHANQPDVRFAKILVSGPPAGDLDRDLQSDRTVFRPSTGVWYSALSNGGATATTWGVSTDIDVQGDYDGDGKSDVAVWRPSTGQWLILRSSDGSVQIVNWGANGDVPLVGDGDGDGKDDQIVYRPSTNKFFHLKSGGGNGTLAWGTTGDQPFGGDFDGDGIGDAAVFRPSNGTWYVWLTAGSPMTVAWGQTGDIPVSGDYDGDGKSDFAVFRPGTGTWYVRNSSGGSTAVTWGAASDYPLSGDQNGDGRSDFIVWRPSTGEWFTQFSSGGVAVVAWGANGDKPFGRVPGS